MKEIKLYLGLDVHKEGITIAIVGGRPEGGCPARGHECQRRAYPDLDSMPMINTNASDGADLLRAAILKPAKPLQINGTLSQSCPPYRDNLRSLVKPFDAAFGSRPKVHDSL